MASFDDATRQVAGLMAAVGGSVDAYEDEGSSSAPDSTAPNFEAAYASVQAHLQHNEPTVGSYSHIKQATEAASGRTEAELLQDMASLSEQLGGLTTNPLEEETLEDYPSPQDETDWSESEKGFFKEMNIDLADADSPEDGSVEGPVDDRFDAKFFDCLTGMYELDQAPAAVESCYKMIGNVVSHGELHEIYTAFKFAQDTGEPQTVTLDSGTYEMTPNHGSDNDMTLHDVGKGRRYVQQSQHTCGDNYEVIEEGDLFIWVIPDDESVEDLGYLHNQWVFLREEE